MTPYEYRKLAGVDVDYIHDPVRGHMTTLKEATDELNRLAAQINDLTVSRNSWMELAFSYRDKIEQMKAKS